MKKRILLFVVLLLVSASFAMADGLVVHFGLGYFASFLAPPFETVEEVEGGEKETGFFKNMPFGFFCFGGIGYGFGTEEAFSLGAEGAYSMAIATKPFRDFYGSLHGRVFFRYSHPEYFSVTGFTGVKGNLSLADHRTTPVFGIRTQYFSVAYLEYAIVLRGDFSKTYSHDISIGFILDTYRD